MTVHLEWDEEALDALDAVECPACTYEGPEEEMLLGTLGNMKHCRCRVCGWQWAEEPYEIQHD